MTATLYAVAVRRADGTRGFRSPTEADLAAAADADAALTDLRGAWLAADVLPTEQLAEKGDRGRSSRPRLSQIRS